MMARLTCYDCGKLLSSDEREYYGATCETCEGAISEAMQADELPPDRRPWAIRYRWVLFALAASCFGAHLLYAPTWPGVAGLLGSALVGWLFGRYQ